MPALSGSVLSAETKSWIAAFACRRGAEGKWEDKLLPACPFRDCAETLISCDDSTQPAVRPAASLLLFTGHLHRVPQQAFLRR